MPGLRSALFLFLSFLSVASCTISEDKVKTIIIVDELTQPKSKITENIFIESKSLHYDLQYRVYTPAGYEKMENLPSIYLLDGQMFIEEGNMPALLDRLIKQKKIQPIVAVFIDSRDPHNLQINRRNNEFLGNEAYIQFLSEELVPQIDADFKTYKSAENRALAGISFGAVAAAFGGIKASGTFHRIGCQSPATHPFMDIYKAYEQGEKLPLTFFLSTGTKNDKLEDTQMFRDIFKAKGYTYSYREVSEGHTWKNWKPLLDDLLIYFFASPS